VAFSLENKLNRGDEILISSLEHHSNILPWQRIATKTGASLRIVNVTATGAIDEEDFHRKLCARTRILALSHVSNVLGTINPVEKMVRLAKKFGTITLIDGAQWATAGPINVQSIDCDFYAISGHKMFGPMGIGILYGKRSMLQDLEPMRLGGGMVDKLTRNNVSYRPLPERMEAGTPNVAGAISLACAFEFLQSFPWDDYRIHENEIRAHVEKEAEKLPGLRLLGKEPNKVGIYAFSHANIHSHDLASILGGKEICVRAGNHCAQLLMSQLDISQSLRASFSIYNTMEDCERFMEALSWAVKQF
jgi:cysteine desulfurase/selenocysteine lyase